MTEDEDKEKTEAYKKFADKLKIEQLKGEGERIQALRKLVQEFEKNYGTDIKLMPAEMQNKYREMRKQAGLPEISEIEVIGPISEKKENTPANLANIILKLGIGRKDKTGGLMLLSELIMLLRTQTPLKKVKIGEVKRVLKRLEKEGLISGLKRLNSGVEIVEFLPTGFNKDQNIILSLASSNGVLTLEEIMLKLNWAQERVLRVLKTLEKSNIAKRDHSYAAGQKWYFPGLIKDS
ncbi:MAG: hypothetical protein ACTSQO_14030 [Candidatus Helarchaeota archaeon]